MGPEQEAQPAMQVSADISRWDLVVFRLYMLPRMTANWIFFGVITALYFFLFFAFGDRNDIGYLAYGVIYCAFFAAVAIAFTFLLSLTLTLFRASAKNGDLGMHVFSLRGDGLHQQSAVDETLNRWQGIYSVIVWKHGLYVRINWYLCHVIPARAFTSRADFENFSTRALELWRAAAEAHS
jgi:hypothetical protein